MLDNLALDDVMTVTRLDRLARSTRDVLNTLAVITDRKASFQSLRHARADTTTSHGRFMLSVLGGLVEFERDLIRTRTSEGRARPKARGVKLGRKSKSTERQKREAIRRRDRGGASAPDRPHLQPPPEHDFEARLKTIVRGPRSTACAMIRGYDCKQKPSGKGTG
jgi:DNA invertase Pin-like site-specific DNA recombinase